MATTTAADVVCISCGAILVPEAALRREPPRCQACGRWADLLTRDDKDFLRTNRIVVNASSELLV